MGLDIVKYSPGQQNGAIIHDEFEDSKAAKVVLQDMAREFLALGKIVAFYDLAIVVYSGEPQHGAMPEATYRIEQHVWSEYHRVAA